MRKLIRYVVLIIVIASAVSIGYGLSILETSPVPANKCIGFGVVGLFMLAMPLFLASESRGKRMKDYMLNEENIRKMRENRGKSAENQ